MADWRIRYGAVDRAFGGGWPLLFDVAPEVTTVDADTGDFRAARTDGLLMGEDLLGGGQVTFGIDIATPDDESGALGLLEELRRVWRADEIRRTPGAVAELVSEWGRTGFGRPRRFAPGVQNVKQGFIPVVADFTLVSDLWFGAERSDSISFVPSLGGGLVAPLVAPLSTTATSDRSQVVTIGGETPTSHVVFEVAGPITNPVIDVVGVATLTFLTTLAYDETLVVDARPWARSITVGGSSRAGALTPASTSLSKLSLPPGNHEIVLRGSDQTGTASLTTRWRDAYTTP